MKAAAARDLESGHKETEERPSLGLALDDAGHEEGEAREIDATQGRQIGSECSDDATQGRQIGSRPYDDATRGRGYVGH